jgi:hypothetical protein
MKAHPFSGGWAFCCARRMVDRKLRIVRVNSTHLRDKQMRSLFATDARRFHLGACKVSLIWLTSPPRNALLTKKLYHLSRLERALTARIFSCCSS